MSRRVLDTIREQIDALHHDGIIAALATIHAQLVDIENRLERLEKKEDDGNSHAADRTP